MNTVGQFGKWLILAGVCLCCIGGLMLILDKIGLFRLPGDMAFGGKNWRVFVPITTCLMLSAALTLLMWIINRFMK